MKTLIKELILAHSLLQEIQKELTKEFKKSIIYKDLTISYEKENFLVAFKKSFFTILMVSLLRKSSIPKNRIISYGKIILLLRQIITSVDNILDKERKGLFFINTLENPIIENSLLSLICQDLLTKELLELQKETGNYLSSNVLLEKMYEIARGESKRNQELYTTYPNPQYILDNIHHQIGGELLEISLTTPNALEKDNYSLEQFSKGLFTIGMSLQGIDDFFDMKEDYENGNVNLATSQYIQEYHTKVEDIEYENLEEEFVKKYLTSCIDTAYKGFEILKEGGFPITKKEAKFVLKKLFVLRGLKEYVRYIAE